MSENTFTRIQDIVRRIPAGRAATYGQIARLAGNVNLSRVVGYAMRAAPPDVPCHRVVNRSGGLSDAFQPLLAEGVPFCADGSVDLSRCAWEG